MADSIFDFDPVAANNQNFAGIPYGPNQLYHNQIDNLFRAYAGALGGFVDDLGAVATPTGSATAVAVTLSQGFTGYGTAAGEIKHGTLIALKMPWAATAAATLAINAIAGTKKIRRQGDAAIEANDWIANGIYFFRYDTAYDSANGAWVLMNAATSGVVYLTNAQAVAGTKTDAAANAANLAEVTKLVAGALPTIANNGTDATNDIDFSAGSAFDLNASAAPYFTACAAMTKRLDADWSAGTGNGMRYSGAAIANTTYHLWAAWKDDGTQDYYADPSATYATALGHLQAETGGSAYTHMRRVGSIIRSGGAILAFTQLGNEFLLNAAVLDINANNPGTAAVTRTLTVPTGVVVWAKMNATLTNTAAAAVPHLIVSELAISDQAPSGTAEPLSNTGDAYNATGGAATKGATLAVRTNTSAQVRSRLSASDASVTLRIATTGWIDTRGRDAA